MKKNMGATDRTIRILLAIVIGLLFWQDVITGTLGYILLALAGIFVLTSFISFCPLYPVLGINTCSRKT
ncbi:YgaP family membrane protein [Luteirhabdus pelagi]|uniref:YgaP family membrane protein n=1 Tax=Luteirhabdus pelagi TaxID=2792783 RepID=UPI00193A6F66|nr:DUF2892 domain-containing protein [Luteirhabdus pelagi]MCT8340667.1 DUF2892 domain-containing protein [Thermobacterium salinum]